MAEEWWNLYMGCVGVVVTGDMCSQRVFQARVPPTQCVPQSPQARFNSMVTQSDMLSAFVVYEGGGALCHIYVCVCSHGLGGAYVCGSAAVGSSQWPHSSQQRRQLPFWHIWCLDLRNKLITLLP